MKTQRVTYKRVTLFALVVVAMLGLTPLQGQVPEGEPVERDASVVYVPMNESLGTVENFNQEASTLEKIEYEYSLDLNGDEINDFRFTSTSLMPEYPIAYTVSRVRIHPLNNNRVTGFVSTDSSEPESYLAGFNKDTQISGILGSKYEWVNDSRVIQGYTQHGTAVGVFDDGGFFFDGPTYTGLEFNIEGQKHYGWIYMDFTIYEDSMGEDFNPNFLGYAYETDPGVAIMTGEVPEPSTYALFVGILSVLALVIQKRFKTLK